MATYQEILTRGQQTVGIWQHFAPTLTFGTLALAGHQADVAALPGADQEVVDAEGVVDEKRDARDASVEMIKEIGRRLPRLAASSLPPEDSLQDDIEQIQSLVTNSDEKILDRGRATLTMWIAANAHRAAATPAQPALTLPKAGGGTWAVAALETALAGMGSLEQQIKDANGPLSAARSARRALATRVDRNNKRWYEGWSAHFPAGTPEHDALSQITTEDGGPGTPAEPPTPPAPPEPPAPTVPGAASIGSVQVSGLDVTLFDIAAEGAETFDVEVRSAGGEFAPQASGVTGSAFGFSLNSAGDYEARIAGRNAAGLGPWSDPAAFTV